MRIASLVITLCAGCATVRPDPQLNCISIRDNPQLLDHVGLRDLARLGYGSPAQHDANGAYAQGTTTIVLRGVGAGALVAGLITGFATNPGTQQDARIAGYSLAGGAVGILAFSFVFDYTAQQAAKRARLTLRQWSSSGCPSVEAPPATE